MRYLIDRPSPLKIRPVGDEATDDELIEQIHNFHVLSRWEEEQGILSQCVLSSQLQVTHLICLFLEQISDSFEVVNDENRVSSCT